MRKILILLGVLYVIGYTGVILQDSWRGAEISGVSGAYAGSIPIRNFSQDDRMTKTVVSIEASDEGIQVYDQVGGNAWIKIPESAAVSVCFMYTQADCTTFTDPEEFICAVAGGYWFTDIAKERWHGQLCGILQSGEVAVDVVLWTRG